MKNEIKKRAHTGNYFPKVEIKRYNLKLDGRNFSHQSINDDTKTNENILHNWLFIRLSLLQRN